MRAMSGCSSSSSSSVTSAASRMPTMTLGRRRTPMDRGHCRRVLKPRASIENPTREETTSTSVRLETFLSRKGRHASFEATRKSARRVHQRADGRTVLEYMSLPASQYSTLDGESVERVDEDTFKVELSEFNFLGFRLKPRLRARVHVRDDGSGCEVRVEDMELSGSGVVESASDSFEIVSVNNVTWRDVELEALTEVERAVVDSEGGEFKEMMSETRVSVYLIVPGWFPFTIKSTERTGRFVVNQVVNQVVPRFLTQLAEDYRTWASGDDSRAATGGGMFDCEVGEEECDVPDATK